MEDITGKQLGPYQIIEPLGEGGMAAVYKAYQPGIEREVALKILPRHFANDPQFVTRFEQEAKMLAQLQHPHILPVFDFGQADGYTYIVMPLLKSGDLTDVMQGKPLPLVEIRRMMIQVGDALEYAHRRGLVHRDVKPSNVLLDESGNCLLTDFGIAKLVESSTNITATGGILGTPTYMSPEQGLGHKLDGRSDIYALGIILYEMTTGRVPYKAETPMAVVVKHINDPLPPPRQVNPAIPQALERVILKAVAKKPEDRYQNAAAMVKALKGAISESAADSPDLAQPPETVFAKSRPTLEEEPEGKKRGSGLAWILALGGVTITGLILFMAAVISAALFYSNSSNPTVTQVAEIAVTLPVKATATATPKATATPTTIPKPIEVPEAATTSPPTATPTPPPVIPEPEPGLACIGSFGLGVTCLDESGNWQTYTKENSPLGSNLVLAIAACPDQRIAIAHSFGISMFDGQDWVEYAEDWGGSPKDIACDANGNLYIVHFGGMSHFDGQTWTIHTSDKFAAGGKPKALVDTVVVAPDGNVWVSTSNSIARFDGSDWTVFEAGAGFDKEYFFDAVTVDNQGLPWAVNSRGISSYDGTAWRHYENHDLVVSKSIAVDANDKVWVGTFNRGIRIFDGQGGWRTQDIQTGNLSSNRVDHIKTDAQGRVWLGTDWGLNVFDGNEWHIYHMHNADIIDNDIRAIAVAGLGPTLPEPVEKEPGALTARFLTRNGDPIANAKVEICVSNISDKFDSTPCAKQPFVIQTTTDADGNALVPEIPTGYYRLVIEHPQYGWVILDKQNSSLEEDEVPVEVGQETNLLVMVTPE